jgi:hypothetical protein
MKIPQRISKKEMAKIHPYIPEAYSKLEQGRINRREFLRISTLLGMSAGVAIAAAACSPGGTTTCTTRPPTPGRCARRCRRRALTCSPAP